MVSICILVVAVNSGLKEPRMARGWTANWLIANSGNTVPRMVRGWTAILAVVNLDWKEPLNGTTLGPLAYAHQTYGTWVGKRRGLSMGRTGGKDSHDDAQDSVTRGGGGDPTYNHELHLYKKITI